MLFDGSFIALWLLLCSAAWLGFSRVGKTRWVVVRRCWPATNRYGALDEDIGKKQEI